MIAQDWSRALFGGVLEGNIPVRYIYVDEAGISANEPVSVVVGIIVHADTQWRVAELRVRQVLDVVPDHLHKNFVFHATAVWSNPKLRKDWSKEERLSLLHAMMRIPRELHIPIALGIVRRTIPLPEELSAISPEKFHHMMAFWDCVSDADRYVRTYGNPDEVATVIAENTDINRELKRGIKRFPTIVYTPEMLMPTQAEKASGIMEQNLVRRITRVIDVVHFVDKEDSPLLQIADACAFGFRRYFAEQSLGEDFVQSILGGQLNRDDWVGFSSSRLFYWHPRKKTDENANHPI